MPTCVIDGREVEFVPGQNLIEVAKKVGIEIPYYCYHPGLSVVAQCRMCSVEIENVPKLQPACATLPKSGMVVKTRSPRAVQNQKAVSEYLLINHPLDCPICDKSGECDLQDYSFEYGDPHTRMTEERRTYVDLDMGPVIVKNMNRCIHCTRCIRFGTEVAGIHEMVATQRGNWTEISTIDGRPLETDYAGNYADICPTGSLLLKDFRFKRRVWFLKKTPTTCEACARGCNMEIHQDGNVIYRCVPRENLEVNKYWLCDEGRFNFHYIHDTDRVVSPMVRVNGKLEIANWARAIETARETMNAKKPAILVGSDLTQQEALLLRDEFLPGKFPGAPFFHFGTPEIISGADDGPADKILKRKSRTANLHGLEKLGYSGFEKLPAGTDAVLIIRGGRAVLPELKLSKIVGIGVFKRNEVENFAAVLPGVTFAEKDGTVVNFQGREQTFRRAIAPPDGCKGLPEILMTWINHKGSVR
ncbi:MAG TPA: 2Fe-2S iron-sulfur cluster-binding protein [Bdellovibrionota bacterium]|nr:2Fe-2S iron-sulfur cluster-binding protein [Bdellovibrionota bacterium]